MYYITNIRTRSVILFSWLFSENRGIIQLSPLLECDPTVCLPVKSKVTRGLARGWPTFSRGDKQSGHTPTRVIIGILYRISLLQTPPNNRIPAALRKYSIYIKFLLGAMFVVCWIKGSNYNWKHVRLTWEFPWDFLTNGGPYYLTLWLAVDQTNG